MTWALILSLVCVVAWPGRTSRWPSNQGRTRVWLPPAGRAEGRRAPAERLDVQAQIAELVTVGLEAGLTPSAALELAESVLPGTDSALQVGDLLDRALTLASRAGTPAAQATRACALALRQQARAARQRESLLAGPRASMVVLTLLPLGGPLLWLAVGVPVSGVVDMAGSRWSVLVGLALTVAGWRVSAAMLAAAARPPTLRSRVSPPPERPQRQRDDSGSGPQGRSP